MQQLTLDSPGAVKDRCCARHCLFTMFTQHASVSQGWICFDNCTSCLVTLRQIKLATATSNSEFFDHGSTSPGTDRKTHGAWKGSNEYQFVSHWYDSTGESMGGSKCWPLSGCTLCHWATEEGLCYGSADLIQRHFCKREREEGREGGSEPMCLQFQNLRGLYKHNT